MNPDVPAARHRRRARGRAGAVLALLLLLASSTRPLQAQTRDVSSALARLDEASIRAHVEFLAGDLLEGRGPGTRGGALAAAYVANQFGRIGLEPLQGRWRHPVPLRVWRADTARTAITIAADNTLRLDAGSGALLWTAAGRDEAAVRAELVFLGYGTRSPEYGWNDYKVDVRGRIVLVLVGDPPAPPGSVDFDGDALTYYGRWTYKVEEAARQGAAGVLLVHDPELTGYGWDVIETGWGAAVLALAEDSAQAAPAVSGWLRGDAARRLLAAAGLDFDALFVRAARRDFQPVATGVELELTAHGAGRNFNGANVAGLLPGSHPQRRDEVLIYTAHYDGLGIGPAVAGDSIYNGAYDNAAGVALLLEIAESFASLRTPPERSVLFLATAAEEAGMLGATHYVRHPLLPLDRTRAVINLEGANFWGETDDITGVGVERSTLGPALERAAALLGLRVSAERDPGQGFFFRSDHFPFARAGVPAIAIDHGLSYRNRPPDWGVRTVGEFLARSYHAPSDELPRDADLAGAVQQARTAFLLGLDVAQGELRPRYYEDLPPFPPPLRLPVPAPR